MDNALTFYQETIKRLLRQRQGYALRSAPSGLDVTCFFDDESKQYALYSIGWMLGKRVDGPTLFLRIKDGRIWVEDDHTSAPIADDLLEAGVPKEDIVLAFHSPETRRHTEFAVA